MTKDNFQKKIYFRADANSQIGWGHLVRCMAVADMLIDNKNSFFECVFLVQNPSLILQNQIKEKFELIILQETTDFLEEAHFITQNYLQDNSIIVLDHYQIQTEYQKIIKQNGNAKIVCIDDMHDWHFVADVVINHAGGLKEKDYSCELYTKLYLGTEYALLRKPFLEAAKQKREINNIETIFICFGGSDIHNLTKKALEGCLSISQVKKIHVVLGSASLFYQEILELSKQNDKIILHQNLSAQQMCKLMKESDAAVAPASSISYEICSVGMYLITGYYVENQKNIYNFLIKNNLSKGVGNFNQLETNLVIKLDDLIQEHLTNQKKYFDGLSAKRIRNIFHILSITFENAKKEDVKIYFDWANETEVRQNSLNSELISWEGHQKWFFQKIANKDSRLFIFKINSAPIGQVRIDFEKEEDSSCKAIIDYSVDVNYRRLGIGKLILQKAIEKIEKEYKHKIILSAIVKKENKSSSMIFEKLNFAQHNHKKNIHFNLKIN